MKRFLVILAVAGAIAVAFYFTRPLERRTKWADEIPKHLITERMKAKP